MKHRIGELLLVITLLIVTVINTIGFAISSFGLRLDHLPEGKFLYSTMSPNGNSTLKIYQVEVKNIGCGIRGEVITVDPTGEPITKNIYWETHAKGAIAAWTKENEVSINGHTVSIHGEPFDSRKEVVLPEFSTKNLLKQQ